MNRQGFGGLFLILISVVSFTVLKSFLAGTTTTGWSTLEQTVVTTIFPIFMLLGGLWLVAKSFGFVGSGNK